MPAVDVVGARHAKGAFTSRFDSGRFAWLRELALPGLDACAVLLFSVFLWRVLFDPDEAWFDAFAVVTGLVAVAAALVANQSIRTFIDGPLCAYTGLCLVSAAVNHARYVPMIEGTPIAPWRPAFHAVALFIYVYGVGSLLSTTRRLGTVVAVIVVAISVFAAAVTYEHAKTGFGGRPWSYAVVGQWGGGGYPEIGTLLTLAAPFPLALLAVSRSAMVSSASALVALALLLDVALLYFRVAYLGVAVAFAVVASLEWQKLRSLRLAVCGAVLLLLLLINPSGLARLWTGAFYNLDTQASVDIRVEIWRKTLALIGDHPVVGVGPGNYTDALRHGYVARPRREDTQAHSMVLRAAAETGLVGLLAFLLLWWRILRRSAAGVAPTYPGMLALGLVGSYAGFLALNSDMALGGLASSDRLAFLLWTFVAMSVAVARAGDAHGSDR